MSIDALPETNIKALNKIEDNGSAQSLTSDEQDKWDNLEKVFRGEGRPEPKLELADTALAITVKRQPLSVTDPTAWDYRPGDERKFWTERNSPIEQGNGLFHRTSNLFEQ